MEKVTEVLNEIGKRTADSSLAIGNAMVDASEIISSNLEFRRQQRSAAMLILFPVVGFIVLAFYGLYKLFT